MRCYRGDESSAVGTTFLLVHRVVIRLSVMVIVFSVVAMPMSMPIVVRVSMVVIARGP